MGTEGNHPRDAGSDDARPRRRVRYPGTHPRRYEQRYKELQPDAHQGIHEHVRDQGRTPAGTHVPVMLSEVLDVLVPRPGDVVADVTLGFAGHALALIERILPDGRYIGLDMDGAALRTATDRLQAFLREQRGAVAATESDKNAGADALPSIMTTHRSHFAGLSKVLAVEGLDGVDVLLADLGASSMQLDNPQRGFSYKHDGPLDMRMDDRAALTAVDLLATLSVEALSDALWRLADEPDHQRIAARIAEHRRHKSLTQTGQLVHLIFEAKGMTRRAWREEARSSAAAQHPAARTFQALRMLVNDELSGLAQFLRTLPWCLRPLGRLAIISFHSGEDRLVDEFLTQGRDEGLYSQISDQPLRPTHAEVAGNPRSRSALLRFAVRASAQG